MYYFVYKNLQSIVTSIMFVFVVQMIKNLENILINKMRSGDMAPRLACTYPKELFYYLYVQMSFRQFGIPILVVASHDQLEDTYVSN